MDDIRTRGTPRSTLLKPLHLVVFFVTLIGFREWIHLRNDASTTLITPDSMSVTVSRGLPLLLPSIPSDQLESWQTNPILVDGVSRRRNPLMPKVALGIDNLLIMETTSRTSGVGEELVLDFNCKYEDDEVAAHCPSGYRVWFVGPSIFSPTYTSSRAIGSDGRRIRVTVEKGRILDPGSYEVFAWPEHADCDLWNHGAPIACSFSLSTSCSVSANLLIEIHILDHQLAVHGSPMKFEITGNPQSESSEMCEASETVTNGRWISKAHIDKSHWTVHSPHWWWLSTHVSDIASYRLVSVIHWDGFHQMSLISKKSRSTFYSYIYVPYACKKPHHSYREWINILKPRSLLIIGDSVLRDLYCTLIYSSLGGDGSDGRGGGSGKMCQWPKEERDIKLYHTTHKSFAYQLPDGNIAETAFAWVPKGSVDALNTYFNLNTSNIPSHISLGVSLWLANDAPDVYVSKIRPAIEMLVNRFPETQINIRTSASTAQAIACYDKIGGQRPQMEANNAALLELLREYPTVTPFDVYPIFNDRPDASSDGRHWASIGFDWMDRPQSGSAEFAVGDELFFSWLSQV